MAISTIGRQVNRRAFALFPETTAFATEETGYDTGKKGLAINEVDTTGLTRPAIENAGVRVTPFAKQPNGVGKKSQESQVTVSCYQFGARTADDTPASKSTDIVVENAFTYLLGAAMGQAPEVFAGSAIDASPTPDAQSFTATTEPLEAGELVAMLDDTDGSVYVRPIAEVSSGYNFAIDMPVTPDAAEDIVLPTIQGKLKNGTITYLVQGEAISPDKAGSYQDVKFRGGAVTSFTLNGSSVFEPANVSATIRVADFDRNVTSVQKSPSPKTPFAEAGGEAILCKFSETTGLALKILNAEITLEKNLALDPDFSNETLAIGGYVPGDGELTVTIHVHDTQALPTASNTPYNSGVSTWEALRVSALETDRQWKLLLAFGNKTAGRGMVYWFPALVLDADPVETEIEGIAAQQLTFSVVAGLSSLASMYFCQY